jgi:formylglycine-generating enzyme required for sulfatase activity
MDALSPEPTQHSVASIMDRPSVVPIAKPEVAPILADDPSYTRGPFVVTRGTHTLDVKNEFSMALHLVTNRLFFDFVQEWGYLTDEYWGKVPTRAREQFLCQDGRTQGPATWLSSSILPPGNDDHPVAGVSYHEALAFTEWLNKTRPAEQPGWEWCLPTEDMWELTARTPTGQRYPWGDTWEPGRCNSRESGLNRTSPVGEFPSGASKAGCHDLAGNVWEFVVTTENDWSCVLRGGSYANDQNEVRSDLRLYRVPRDHRPPDFGFRCAARPKSGA